MLSLGCGSKNSDVFLGKDLEEGSEEIQKANMVVWIEGGSCSFNENRENKFVVLVAFKGILILYHLCTRVAHVCAYQCK